MESGEKRICFATYKTTLVVDAYLPLFVFFGGRHIYPCANFLWRHFRLPIESADIHNLFHSFSALSTVRIRYIFRLNLHVTYFSMADNGNIAGGGLAPPAAGGGLAPPPAGVNPGAGLAAAVPADVRHQVLGLSLEELQRQRMGQRLSFQVAPKSSSHFISSFWYLKFVFSFLPQAFM